MVGKFDHNDYNLSSLGVFESFIHFFVWVVSQSMMPITKGKKKVLIPPMVEEYI
jgi:hypothetical protein